MFSAAQMPSLGSSGLVAAIMAGSSPQSEAQDLFTWSRWGLWKLLMFVCCLAVDLVFEVHEIAMGIAVHG